MTDPASDIEDWTQPNLTRGWSTPPSQAYDFHFEYPELPALTARRATRPPFDLDAPPRRITRANERVAERRIRRRETLLALPLAIVGGAAFGFFAAIVYLIIQKIAEAS